MPSSLKERIRYFLGFVFVVVLLSGSGNGGPANAEHGGNSLNTNPGKRRFMYIVGLRA